MKRIVISTITLALVVVGIVLRDNDAHTVDASVGTVTPTFAPRLALAPGSFVEHDVTIQETTRVLPLGGMGATQPMEGVMRLSMRVRFEAPPGVPTNGTSQRLRLRFPSVDEASLELDGRAALPADTADTLQNAVAYIEQRADGTVTALELPNSDDPTVRRLIAYALGELRVSLSSSSSSWRAEERLPRGTFEAQWRVTSADAERMTLARAPRVFLRGETDIDASKSEVKGQAMATIAARGVLESLVGEERTTLRDESGVTVEERTVMVQQILIDEGTLDDGDDAPTFAGWQALPLEEMAMSDAAGRDMLSRRAEGMTRAHIKETLAGAVTNGAIADPQRFLWRATAVIRLDDAVVDDIGELFVRDDAEVAGRALFADVLVAAGTEAAQVKLIELLDLPAIEQSPARTELRQRLALLQAPTAETVAFLDEKSKAAHVGWRDPARLALGSAVRHLGEIDPVTASRAFAALEREARTVDDDGLEVMLMSYGNTYDARALPFLLSRRADTHPQRRHVVAGALRGIDSDEARGALLDFVRDSDAGVARRAFASLQAQPPLVSTLESVRGAVAARAVSPRAFNALVTLCAKQLQDPALKPAALKTLHVVLAQADDARLMSRVRMLLRRHEAP